MQHSELTTADIRAFRDECIHARAIFVHFQDLFESEKTADVVSVAPIFFGDVCRALKLYLFVEVCKLTDPAATAKQWENLSTEFLRASVRDEKLLTQLAPLCKGFQDFRNLAKPARDKLASHMDLTTTRTKESIGEIDKRIWNRFWKDLQKFVYLLSSHYLGEQVYINSVSNQSDVPALIAAVTGAPP